MLQDNRSWLKPVVKALTSENHVVRRYVSEVILVTLMKAYKSTGAILLSCELLFGSALLYIRFL